MSARDNVGRWIFLMQQIHEAGHYASRAQELGHPHLWTTYEAILDFLAFFRGAVIAYAKCFGAAGKGRVHLQSSDIFRGAPEHLAQHDLILAMRHKYAAHSDENVYEAVEVLEDDREDELVLRTNYNWQFPFDRLYELQTLIRIVELWTVDRSQAHLRAVEREIGKPVRIADRDDT